MLCHVFAYLSACGEGINTMPSHTRYGRLIWPGRNAASRCVRRTLTAQIAFKRFDAAFDVAKASQRGCEVGLRDLQRGFVRSGDGRLMRPSPAAAGAAEGARSEISVVSEQASTS